MHRRLLQYIGWIIAMRCKNFKVPNAVRNWAALGTLHYIGMLHEIFTFLLMEMCQDQPPEVFRMEERQYLNGSMKIVPQYVYARGCARVHP